jgi:predicted transglutaminase-like cysteine proteinase
MKHTATLTILQNLCPKMAKGVNILVGAAFFVGTLFVPMHTSQALEYTGGAQFTHASVRTNVSLTPSVPAQGLFGAGEQRFTDLSAFTKWNGVLDRFKKDLMVNINKPHVKKWMAFLLTIKDKSPAEQVEAVNQYMNSIKFVADADNYGASDYWATPIEFLARGGDCEDYAIAKYVSLVALGFSKDQLRLAIVNDRVMRAPHATLIVYDGTSKKVLDNQNPSVADASQITRYVPIYSISQVAWWRH